VKVDITVIEPTWLYILPNYGDVMVPFMPGVFVEKAHGVHELVYCGSHSGQAARALEIQLLGSADTPHGRPAASTVTRDDQVVSFKRSRYETDACFLVEFVHGILDHQKASVTLQSSMKSSHVPYLSLSHIKH
jgi:hypothetical protein